ncbi:MAG: ATP-binding cassette domain-containing protein [Rikenellaceae bacterium]
MNNTISVVDGVTRLPQYHSLQPLNITIAAGEQVAIIGENGSGKSIVASILAGALPLKDEGVKYNFGEGRSSRVSENIAHLAFRDSYGIADRGYYHQQRWNSFDREGQPIVSEKLPQCDDQQLKESIFKLFDIDSMLSKEMILLSSGELRRFQLTKALLKNPKVLILEDPFIGLDAHTRQTLSQLLGELSMQGSLQIILILSKIDDLPPFITHVIPMKSGACGTKVEASELVGHLTHEAVPTLSKQAKERIMALETKVSAHTSDEVINLNNVTIRYDDHIILKDLSWRIMRGEHWALSGDNGAGKSTLLSLIFADIPQGYSCDIHRFGRKQGAGESIWDIKRDIGYVSPEIHRAYCEAIPTIEIVASGLHDTIGLYRKMREEERAVCIFWMEIFGIAELQDRSFMAISSGEQRLVLLARAFVKDPELLILDEPLHGLDLKNRRLVLDIVECFSRRANKSLIYVSHYKNDLPQSITHSLHLTKSRT